MTQPPPLPHRPAAPPRLQDIRIVGGGAAGLVTALELLNGPHARDYRITIYERADAPYTTLCAEGISDATLRQFTAFDSLAHVAQTFKGAAWHFPGEVTVNVDQTCHTLNRASWIPAMVEAFRSLGGEYRTGVKMSPERIAELAAEADVVIGADGPGSQARRFVGGSHELKLGLQYRMDGRDFASSGRLEFFTDKRFSPEYAWIFPRGEILNVGLLATGDGKDWERLDAFAEAQGLGQRQVLKREAYPIGFLGTAFQRDNVLLVGDAAGLTNPLTKGGLAAIVYAAAILAKCLAQDAMSEYQTRLMAHPLTSPHFRGAVEAIHRLTNSDFERLVRFAPSVMTLGNGSARKRYTLPLLISVLTNLNYAPDLWVLVKAMRLSRRYSW